MTTLARGASSHFMTSISGTAENGVRRGLSPAGHAVRLQLRASAAQNLTCQILRLHPDHAVRSYPQAAAVTSRCHRSFDDHHGYRDPVRQPRSSVRAGVLRFQMLNFARRWRTSLTSQSGPRSRNLPASARSFATPVLTACRSSSMCYRGDEHR
jgi:hypothetical protein